VGRCPGCRLDICSRGFSPPAAPPRAYIGRRGAQGLNEIAFQYINTHGKDLHGQPLGQYFIHGVSHPIGLNVYDPIDFPDFSRHRLFYFRPIVGGTPFYSVARSFGHS